MSFFRRAVSLGIRLPRLRFRWFDPVEYPVLASCAASVWPASRPAGTRGTGSTGSGSGIRRAAPDLLLRPCLCGPAARCTQDIG